MYELNIDMWCVNSSSDQGLRRARTPDAAGPGGEGAAAARHQHD